jgi:hypothetical protein
MSNKVLKQSYNSPPSPAYFAIRKANIAFVAEYILYAMPGEEAYGKNDIVFACEGFLPLVLDRGLVQDEESWKLFNELKVQVECFFAKFFLHHYSFLCLSQSTYPNSFFFPLDLYPTARSRWG